MTTIAHEVPTRKHRKIVIYAYYNNTYKLLPAAFQGNSCIAIAEIIYCVKWHWLNRRTLLSQDV